MFYARFAHICHAEGGPQHAGLCMPALPLSHAPTTVQSYNEQGGFPFFWFGFGFGAFSSHQHLIKLNKTHILNYLVSAAK